MHHGHRPLHGFGAMVIITAGANPRRSLDGPEATGGLTRPRQTQHLVRTCAISQPMEGVLHRARVVLAVLRRPKDSPSALRVRYPLTCLCVHTPVPRAIKDRSRSRAALPAATAHDLHPARDPANPAPLVNKLVAAGISVHQYLDGIGRSNRLIPLVASRMHHLRANMACKLRCAAGGGRASTIGDRQSETFRLQPTKIIHIDIDPLHSNRVKVDVPIVGRARSTADCLNAASGVSPVSRFEGVVTQINECSAATALVQPPGDVIKANVVENCGKSHA